MHRSLPIIIAVLGCLIAGCGNPVDLPYIGFSPPADTGDEQIYFEWLDAGINLKASRTNCTIQQGETVTISAPVNLPKYEWYVDAKIIKGETGPDYIFDSGGREAGVYTITLWAGSSIGGDAIKIIVKED